MSVSFSLALCVILASGLLCVILIFVSGLTPT